MPIKDMTGKRFGRLQVIKLDPKRGGKQGGERKNAYWICQCDCGKLQSVNGSSLRIGTTNSCGCLKYELMRQRSMTWGKLAVIHEGVEMPFCDFARKYGVVTMAGIRRRITKCNMDLISAVIAPDLRKKGQHRVIRKSGPRRKGLHTVLHSAESSSDRGVPSAK
jgi:hypothetical protein